MLNGAIMWVEHCGIYLQVEQIGGRDWYTAEECPAKHPKLKVMDHLTLCMSCPLRKQGEKCPL